MAEFVKIIAHNGVREICELGICNDAYRGIVGEFVRKLPFFYYEKKINTFTILPMLFRRPIAGYYDS